MLLGAKTCKDLALAVLALTGRHTVMLSTFRRHRNATPDPAILNPRPLHAAMQKERVSPASTHPLVSNNTQEWNPSSSSTHHLRPLPTHSNCRPLHPQPLTPPLKQHIPQHPGV